MNYLRTTPDTRLHLGEIVRPTPGRIGLSSEIEAIVEMYGEPWLLIGVDWLPARLLRTINTPGLYRVHGRWPGLQCGNTGCLRHAGGCYQCQPQMNEILVAARDGVEPQTHRTKSRHYCQK